MNDDTDKPLNTVGDDALEARITAWVLGEASSFEAGELEKLCAADPALGLFERRLRVLHGLVAEDFTAGPAAEWKLAAERRAKITDLLGVAPQVEEILARRKKSRGPSVRGLILALAACVVLGFISVTLTGGVGMKESKVMASRSMAAASGSADAPANRETLAQLERAVAQQRDLVEEKRQQLAQVIRSEGVVYNQDRGTRRYDGTTAEDEAEVAARAYDHLDQTKIQLESQIETLLKYDGEKLYTHALGLDVDGNNLASKVPEFQRAKRDFETLRASGIGERHPEMVAKGQELAEVEAGIQEEVANLRETLRTKLELTKEQASRLETRFKPDLADNAMSMGIANQSFVDAKKDFEESQRLLEELQTQAIAGKMQAREMPTLEMAQNTSSYRQARAGVNLDETSIAPSRPAGSPPPAAMPVAPAAKPASGPAPEDQALALNEPQPATRAKESGAVQPGIGGGGAGGVRAEDGPGEPAQPLASLTNRDFISPGQGATIPGIPAAPGSEVTDIVTGGNRSGDGAITRNNIDAVLNNPARQTKAEGEGKGIAALTGMVSDEAIDTILESVEEKSDANGRGLGGDIAGAPDLASQNSTVNGVRGTDPLGGAGGVPMEPPADSRFALNLRAGSERTLEESRDTAFGNLEELGRLTGERKAEAGGRLGGVYLYDNSSGVTNGVANLSDQVRKEQEVGQGIQPDKTSAAWLLSKSEQGGLAPEARKSLADAQAPEGSAPDAFFNSPELPRPTATPAPAATGEFEGFVQMGEPINRETRDEGTKDRFRKDPGIAGQAVNGGLKQDLSKDLGVIPADSGVDGGARTRAMKSILGLQSAMDAPAVADPAARQTLAKLPAKPGDADLNAPIPITPAPLVTDPAAVEEVRRKLSVADGASNLGKYEESQKAYEEVLRIDPYNKAARRGMEQVAQATADYYRAAYDQTRAELLADVDKAWELSVPPVAGEAATDPAAATDPIRSNLALGVDGGAEVDEVRRKLYVAEGNYNLGKYDESRRVYEDVLRVDPDNKAARRGLEQVAVARNDYYRAAYDQSHVGAPTEADGAVDVPPVSEKVTELETLLDFDKAVPGTEGRYSGQAEKEMLRRQGAVAQSDSLRDEGRTAYAAGNFAEAYRKYVESLQVLPDAPVVKDRRDYIQQVLQDAAEALAITAERVGEKELAAKWKEKRLEWAPKKTVEVEPTAETLTTDEPFSTFSLHVSDASFKLAHAAMERGEVPAAEGIRPEEFYNAFDYGDPAPANGEPVVCVTEQSAHPAFAQRNLLRIGVRTGSQGRGASTPLNLTLLLDHSGSMEREDRNAGLAMAVRQLSGLLKEGDTITVAGFSRQPRLLADRLPGERAQELNDLIARTPSEGGTNLEEGLKLGEELAKRQFNPAAQNRVVLFTDGAANLGDARPEALQARIEGLRQQGIAFDAAGFGADGLNDKLLERLTRNGNGRYYIVDGPEDADAGFAKQLAGAFRPAAENVKVQVRFNPARVAKYKLIGFEEHRLQKEDFRNDAVDAAEMAAEEAGNALYQIETLPQGEGEVGEVSVRFRDVASGRMVERTWTIPYDAQAPAFDQATPSIQLAGLAAFAAEKLRAAPMADAVDFQQLGQVYAGVRARYPNSQPVADLGSMIGKMK